MRFKEFKIGDKLIYRYQQQVVLDWDKVSYRWMHDIYIVSKVNRKSVWLVCGQLKKKADLFVEDGVQHIRIDGMHFYSANHEC